MILLEFRNKIKTKDVEGNRTYLYLTVNGCKYGQSYQNTVNTLDNMKDQFTMFYYPMACEDRQNKWGMKGEGYNHIKCLGNGEHLLKNIDGDLEVWFSNKNHASYGLIYKNTHLEFARGV